MESNGLPLELVTVSSAGFVAGTQTMLDSFLHHNPWFDGPLTVIHDDLPAPVATKLKSMFPRLTCRAPSGDLARAIDRLVSARPSLASRYRRFFSLDLFDGMSVRPALFVDSDVLFCASIEAVASLDAPIAASGDRAYLAGIARDPETLAEGAGSPKATPFRSFNAGFVRVSHELRRAAIRQRVLDELAPARWSSVASDHTDQAVLNRLFGTEVHILDHSYNLMLGHLGRLGAAAGSTVQDARVLHFNGRAKPWQMDDKLRAMADDPDFSFALSAWHAAYRRFMARRTGDAPAT
jgi:lipopolysaccharide biosynthesis glycosyltransferase